MTLSVRNQTLGKGELHFSLFTNTTSFLPAGFRYLGMTEEFNVKTEAQMLDLYDTDHGIKELSTSVPVQTNRTGSFTANDIQPENLALFFFGTSSLLTQTAASALTETFTVKKGQSYILGLSNTNPTGLRNVTVNSAKVATVTKAVGTDYTLDAARGILSIASDGSIDDGASVVVNYDAAAVTRDFIVSGNTPIQGALQFRAFNPVGKQFDYYMPCVRLTPNGDFSLKGDQWQKMPFNVSVMKLANREAIYIDGQPYTAS